MRLSIRIFAWLLLVWAGLEFIMGGVPTGRMLLLTIWGVLLYYLSSRNIGRGITSMKEIEELENCFKKLGVSYTKHKWKHEWSKDYSNSKNQIFVSQAIFHFDRNGKFLAVEDDEMGNWRPRKQSKKEEST